ncbi:MAG: mannose-6-phosphate isomerase, class I, partial [Mycobacteriaceae bacterium]
MQQLRGTVRSYAWGSRTAIAELTGRPVPTDRPEAELWLGAHPASPSSVCVSGISTSLMDVIERDPQAQLGPGCRATFGDRLPFLLKVLAAEEPLSLQAHPSAEQAQQGYAAEQRRRIPLDSPKRSYRDRHHKPELVCALTSFDALVGFRAIDRTIALLQALDCPALLPDVELLTAQPNAEGLRALFTRWITLPTAPLRALLPTVAARCAAL